MGQPLVGLYLFRGSPEAGEDEEAPITAAYLSVGRRVKVVHAEALYLVVQQALHGVADAVLHFTGAEAPDRTAPPLYQQS